MQSKKKYNMGTRNLTAVMLDGKYVVAQYAQWDGYPSGQGAVILDFAKKNLTTEEGQKAFKEKLANVRFVTESEIENALKIVGAANGWLTMEQSNLFNGMFPYLSRDHGGKILKLILESTGEVLLTNEIEFVKDSLFCEYAYVIDLDKGTFEAYNGYQKTPLPDNDRFAQMGSDKEGYYPVKMVGSWSLKELPSQKELCAAFKTD